ncbi:MAG: guanitoxin biosynthesis MBL fold metallo-hydrolase GntH [Devosia sp.]
MASGDTQKPGTATSEHIADDGGVDRRSFLKRSGTVAGGLAAASVAGAASAAAEQSTTAASAATTGGDEGVTKLKTVVARPDLWFYPGEELDPNEMRVTLMGTGWGNIIRHDQKGASIFVELGNGDSFIFDIGPGSGINYNTMQVPASRMSKIFLTHLHTDHTSDLAWVYTFGPASDRFVPLEVYGPSGPKPELGTKANIEGIKTLTQWHRPTFEATLNVGQAYDLEITELDYRQNPGVAYEKNGVKITHFPALHIADGAISYRLDWNGLSFVWSGDTQPNHFVVDNAQGVDLLIHETAPSVERFSQATGQSMEIAKGIVAASHTPAKALGKILQLTNPSLGVTCHSPIDPQEWQDFYNGVASHWDGKYQIGEDLMVFNVSKDTITVRKGGIHGRPWQPNVVAPAATTPTTNVKDLQSEMFQTEVLKDY